MTFELVLEIFVYFFAWTCIVVGAVMWGDYNG